MSEDCIFCKIASGELPASKVWEDEKHLAFLSIFPNTEGVTVVIPKQHYPSYIFDLPDEVITDLILTAKKVALKLDATFEDVARTGLIFEGYGVNHIHAKLYPMHGTKMPEWKPLISTHSKYFKQYEGYLSSHDCDRADDAELDALAKKIRGE